jgi:hypothetical protein
MKSLTLIVLVFLSGSAFADVTDQGDQNFKCQTTGGFFDFSPDGAVAKCRSEIDAFCKTKGAPPFIGKIIGIPSGPARYARAEINFQCMTTADIANREERVSEAQSKQIRSDVDKSKRLCQEDFGFTPNTAEFGNCLMELQKQYFANRRVKEEAAAQREVVDAQLEQRRQSEADANTMRAIESLTKKPPPGVQTNCTTFGTNTTCTSR